MCGWTGRAATRRRIRARRPSFATWSARASIVLPTMDEGAHAMKQRRARIAVIGAGWWSTSTHIPGLLDDPAAEVVALCDADEGRLRAAAARFEIARTYTDVGEMLRRERIDGAVI